MIEIEALAALIEKVLPKTVWFHDRETEASETAKRHGSRALVGDGEGWHFVVMDFLSPEGKRVADGHATKDRTGIRLTPELAQMIFDYALKAAGE